MSLSEQYYPFIKSSESVLSRTGVTFESIDNTNTYDEILKEACHDILSAVTRKPIDKRIIYNEVNDSGIDQQVLKFYLSLMIIKPSTILTRQFTRYYITKFQIIVQEELCKTKNILKYYFTLFEEFGIKWQLVKIGEVMFIKCKLLNYLDFETLLDNNDPPDYQLLRIANCTVHGGYVYFYHKDNNDFQHMLNKLLEERIRNLVNSIQEVECKKIEQCRKQLNKYMQDKEGLSYQPNPKVLSYGEVSNRDLINNEGIVDTFASFTNDERFMSVLEMYLPPCITVLLDQIRRKQELNHAQNILLCSYLSAKGYTLEQMLMIFKNTVNFDKKVSTYNIKYILRKKLKPMNCRNLEAENLCNKHLDKTRQCSYIKNPLSFKEVIRNE